MGMLRNAVWGHLGGSVSYVLDFSSGHDLTVCGFEPCVGLCADSSEPGACFRFCVSPAISTHAHTQSRGGAEREGDTEMEAGSRSC